MAEKDVLNADYLLKMEALDEDIAKLQNELDNLETYGDMALVAEQTEWYEDEFEVCDSRNGCYGCEYHICKLEQTEPTCSEKPNNCTEPQTDCAWK